MNCRPGRKPRPFTFGGSGMHRGYTKRWRKRWDKGYHKDWLLFMLMEYFIDHANWEDREFFHEMNKEMILVRRGECYFTHSSLAAFFTSPVQNVSRKMIASRVAKLCKIGFLGRIKGHRYQIVRVLKYDTYNQPESGKGRTDGHRTATGGPQVGHRTATSNNYKELKEVKIYIPKNFELTDKMRNYALDWSIDPEKVDALFESFKDYHETRKTKYVKWDRVWQTWVRNAPKFSEWALLKDSKMSDKTKNNLTILRSVSNEEP